MQGRIDGPGGTGRFDDVVGGGWVVLTTGWDATEQLSLSSRGLLETLAAHVVHVEPPASAAGALIDIDGTYRSWLAGLEADAVVIRPDFYLFGAADGPSDLDAALEDLRAQLRVTVDLGPSPATAVARDGAG